MWSKLKPLLYDKCRISGSRAAAWYLIISGILLLALGIVMVLVDMVVYFVWGKTWPHIKDLMGYTIGGGVTGGSVGGLVQLGKTSLNEIWGSVKGDAYDKGDVGCTSAASDAGPGTADSAGTEPRTIPILRDR